MPFRHLENLGKPQGWCPRLDSAPDQILPLSLGEVHILPRESSRNPFRIASEVEKVSRSLAFGLGHPTADAARVTNLQSRFQAHTPDLAARANPLRQTDPLFIRSRPGKEEISISHYLNGPCTRSAVLPGLVSSDSGLGAPYVHPWHYPLRRSR